MMMRALEAGGMKVDRAPKGYRVASALPGTPMLHDVYELTREDRRMVFGTHVDTGEPISDDARLPGRHRGRLIKALTGTVRYMYPQPDGIICVFMMRDVEAIRRSYADLNPGGVAAPAVKIQKAVDEEWYRWTHRPDARAIALDYDDVLADPLDAMQRLKEHGFPIDPKKAARVIESDRIHPAPELVTA